jgi:hypothetical protein
MTFDCHGQPILLPAELDGCFTQPESIFDFHEVLERLDPALKEIFTLVSHSPHGHYLRRYAADFVIQDYINFISRIAPSRKCFWEGYNDGPRKHSFVHCQCSGFMAYLARPETKAKLQQRRQAIDTREAAGRKRAQAFNNDPHEWNGKPPPPSAPASSAAEQTPRATIEEAKARAKKIIEEAQAEAVRIKAKAQSTQPARNSRQPDNEIIFLREDDEDDTDEACPTIQFIRPTGDTNEA